MINKDRNVRFNITISKKQFKWLKDFAQKKNITVSKLISWLLAKKTRDVDETTSFVAHPNEEVEKISEEDINDWNETIAAIEKLKEERTRNKNL